MSKISDFAYKVSKIKVKSNLVKVLLLQATGGDMAIFKKIHVYKQMKPPKKALKRVTTMPLA